MTTDDVKLNPEHTTHRASLLQRTLNRAILVLALHLGLFELVQQLSVHWRESTGELWLMTLSAITLLACVWAVIPVFGAIRLKPLKPVLGGATALALFGAIFAGDYFYSWHLRPNLGLYQEPEWVQQHPGFQRQLRQRIEANLWRGGKQSPPLSGPN